MKKFFKILFGILFVPYLIVVIFLTVCLLNYNDYNLTVLGKNTLVIVEDDELEPTYKKGDLVVVNQNDYTDVEVGDNVFFYDTYQNEISINLGKVTKTEKITDDEYTFMMEGDYPVSSEFFVGKAETSNTYSGIGTILAALESRVGYLLFVVLPILLIFMGEIYAIIIELKKPKVDE